MIPVLGIPTMTRHDLAQRCIDSIDYPVEKLLIVNNDGDDWEPRLNPFVREYHQVCLPTNFGCAGAWNMVIKCYPFAPFWLIASDDTYFTPGALELIDAEADPNGFQHLSVEPLWAAFVIGEGAVRKAGLASELFHPVYFEDNDWQRRLEAAGVPISTIEAKIGHDNSSTLKSGFEARNADTFAANHKTHMKRTVDSVMSGGEWDLDIRRMNSWD